MQSMLMQRILIRWHVLKNAGKPVYYNSLYESSFEHQGKFITLCYSSLHKLILECEIISWGWIQAIVQFQLRIRQKEINRYKKTYCQNSLENGSWHAP